MVSFFPVSSVALFRTLQTVAFYFSLDHANGAFTIAGISMARSLLTPVLWHRLLSHLLLRTRLFRRGVELEPSCKRKYIGSRYRIKYI